MTHKSGLLPKRQRFVEEFFIDFNGTQAAIRAGYSPRTANEQSARLLAQASVQAAIAERRDHLARRAEITQERVLAEYARIAFADMAEYLQFHDDGTVTLNWSRIPEGATRAISEIVQEEVLDGKGDGAVTVRRTKFKLHDKLRALDSIAKHLGLFAGKGENPVTNNILVLSRSEAEAEVLSRLQRLIPGEPAP